MNCKKNQAKYRINNGNLSKIYLIMNEIMYPVRYWVIIFKKLAHNFLSTCQVHSYFGCTIDNSPLKDVILQQSSQSFCVNCVSLASLYPSQLHDKIALFLLRDLLHSNRGHPCLGLAAIFAGMLYNVQIIQKSSTRNIMHISIIVLELPAKLQWVID